MPRITHLLSCWQPSRHLLGPRESLEIDDPGRQELFAIQLRIHTASFASSHPRSRSQMNYNSIAALMCHPWFMRLLLARTHTHTHPHMCVTDIFIQVLKINNGSEKKEEESEKTWLLWQRKRQHRTQESGEKWQGNWKVGGQLERHKFAACLVFSQLTFCSHCPRDIGQSWPTETNGNKL